MEVLTCQVVGITIKSAALKFWKCKRTKIQKLKLINVLYITLFQIQLLFCLYKMVKRINSRAL